MEDEIQYWEQHDELSPGLRERLDKQVAAICAERSREEIEAEQDKYWYMGNRHYARTDATLFQSLRDSYIADQLTSHLENLPQQVDAQGDN